MTSNNPYQSPAADVVPNKGAAPRPFYAMVLKAWLVATVGSFVLVVTPLICLGGPGLAIVLSVAFAVVVGFVAFALAFSVAILRRYWPSVAATTTDAKRAEPPPANIYS